MTAWNDSDATEARREIARAMSRQAARLERSATSIRSGAQTRLKNARLAMAIWQMADKEAEFGHLTAEGYLAGHYTPIASLVRTLFEDATLLAWLAQPDNATAQAARVTRAVLSYYRTARNKDRELPGDASNLLAQTTGAAARKPPSMEDRVKQLDAAEHASDTGIAFWASHLDHVELLNGYVHANLDGPNFTDGMTRELLGFEALVFGHQYLTLSIVSLVGLSDLTHLGDEAQEAFGDVHPTELEELHRLLKP